MNPTGSTRYKPCRDASSAFGLFAVMNYYKSGNLNIRYALLISLAFLIGGYFGSKIALNIPFHW
jgi:uncharacterized membrane protein YfcA